MSALKDAWELKVPYVLLLPAPTVAMWLMSKLLKACMDEPEAAGLWVAAAGTAVVIVVVAVAYIVTSRNPPKGFSFHCEPCHCADLATF